MKAGGVAAAKRDERGRRDTEFANSEFEESFFYFSLPKARHFHFCSFFRITESSFASRKRGPARGLRWKVRYRTFLRFFSQNFRRLVLGCINADFCVQILILQRFSRSTRLPHLRTARNSKFLQIFVQLFSYFK